MSPAPGLRGRPASRPRVAERGQVPLVSVSGGRGPRRRKGERRGEDWRGGAKNESFLTYLRIAQFSQLAFIVFIILTIH